MGITVTPWHEPETWDRFVAASPSPHFQQSWAWGDLAPSLGGSALRLAALDGDTMVGAMQVFVNRLGRLRKTHLYVPRGPSVTEPSTHLLAALFDAARDAGRERGAIGIRVEPDVPADNQRWSETLTSLGFRPAYPPAQPRSSWVLDIDVDEDRLLAGMKQKTRYNVRLAARKGVEVCEGSEADLDDFFQLLRETARRDGFFIHSAEVYRRIFALFWRENRFSLLLARYRGEAIAAVTLMRFGPTCWYLHGASSNAHRNLMAPYLLQWEGIRWARVQGCKLYDFRAVPDLLREDQDMYGVYRFKEGFGGRHVTTLHTYAHPYESAIFGLWQLYFRGRFALDARQRRRHGLPARQFA
jgi:peptidoglycan pentaglycine glycine transferase (the first glycine)